MADSICIRGVTSGLSESVSVSPYSFYNWIVELSTFEKNFLSDLAGLYDARYAAMRRNLE